MAQPVDTLKPPPFSAFLKLLVDSDDDASLRRLIKKYPAPELQHWLLRHLRGFRYNHLLARSKAEKVSKARAWFKKRDRWRKRISEIDKELDALLILFAESPVYPLLRATDSLSENYHREVDHVFEALTQLKNSIESSSILSRQFNRPGHQAQPYLQQGVNALRSLGITVPDAREFLTLIGIKSKPPV